MRGLLPSKLILSLIGLIAAFAICVAYLFSDVLKLPLTGSPDQVRVELPRTGGLFEGSAASYRGVRVGTVDSLRINPDGGVVAMVSLTDGTEVPKDTAAQVRSLSPVGEQYLDFQPESAEGPYLADGDVISGDAIDVPVSFAEAADSVNGFIEVVDEEQLRSVLRELGTAFDGAGGDLETLLLSADELSTTLDSVWPETRELLRNGETVGELFERNQERLDRFSSSAATLAAFLRDFDPTFRAILKRSAGDFDDVTLLVDDLKPVLPPLLTELESAGQLLWERETHLRALPESLTYGLTEFASAFDDGWLNVDLWLQGAQECDYRDVRANPRSNEREPMFLDGRCSVDGPVRRGAQFAPPPVERP